MLTSMTPLKALLRIATNARRTVQRTDRIRIGTRTQAPYENPGGPTLDFTYNKGSHRMAAQFYGDKESIVGSISTL
eukprot:4370411-Pleurochrysis_carterae.AAC.2